MLSPCGCVGQEELLGQGLVLEQEAVVGGDEDVGGVGVRRLLHQVDQRRAALSSAASKTWRSVPGLSPVASMRLW